MIAIIDYGIGNLLAIKNIIQKLGGDAIITSDMAKIKNASKLILSGVGAFGYGMRELQKRNLVDLLNEEVLEKKKIVLGMCLGAQLMTMHSEEDDTIGLGWVNGKTVKFDILRVPIFPHMGWSDVKFTDNYKLGANIDEPRFYFAHSYHFQFDSSQYVTGTTEFRYSFPCCFQSENVYGVQFHPEKSHRFGMGLFTNFLQL